MGKSEDKRGFLFRDSWMELFKNMPRREAGVLIKAMCAFANGEEVKIEDLMVLSIFNFIKEQMEENAITDGE